MWIQFVKYLKNIYIFKQIKDDCNEGQRYWSLRFGYLFTC